ncbi:MAG TPA: hypothetical protein VNO30_28285 [Kofleriaceae bacterium]|nr:hypothetical protein [Kofleriaceae bacterium]
MTERHRIICGPRAVCVVPGLVPRLFLGLCLGCALLAAGCGGSSKREVKAAKQSVYNADFAVVFAAALEATRELYPSLDDSPGAGMIKTAWHQVQYANSQDDLANQRTIAQGQGMGRGMSPALAGTSMPTRLAYKRYFIRFDVSVVGGRPWRVKVVGHASEWEPGNALPNELHGPARPPWLEGRTDALTVAIHKRIRPYAIPAKEEVAEDKAEGALPKTDPKQWKSLPPPAAARLAQLKDAIVLRDYKALRAQLADDVVWSLGGAPGADTAMAMWQADPEALDALVRTIESCAAPEPKRVTCPGGEPTAGAWQLVLEPRGTEWKVASFVKAE